MRLYGGPEKGDHAGSPLHERLQELNMASLELNVE